jgi:CrcB protein
MILLLIALGGAAGSVLRYLIGGRVQHFAPHGFPLGTLFVNVAGCLGMSAMRLIAVAGHGR